MKKEKYEHAELEIIKFPAEDVIRTANTGPSRLEEDELPFVPVH